MDIEELVNLAIKARDNAHAPYSGFKVGAALLLENGEVSTGANVENASYGLTMCAERIAVLSAVAAGEKDFRALAIATNSGVSMCGACRQVLREFTTDLPIHLADESGKYRTTSLAEQLPDSFGPEHLSS